MTKTIPMLQKFMTTTPIYTQKGTPLLEALKIMKSNKIRHLPVMDQAEVVGILSESDIDAIQGFKLVNMETLKVQDCYTPNAYCVSPYSNLDEVLDVMAEHKYGCVVVTDNSKLVGIFTWVDALRAASALLRTRLSK